MKILYIKGNLFESNYSHIAHGCNCQGVMGSGVAKVVKELFPDAYSKYLKEYTERGLTIGTVVAAGSNGKMIYNCMTQDSYGTHKVQVDYDAVRDCMRFLNTIVTDAIAMPKIGAGLGGDDWKLIEAIIEEEFTRVQPVVFEL